MKEVIEINNFLKTGKVNSLFIGMHLKDFIGNNIKESNFIEPYSQDELSVFYDYEHYEVCFYKNFLVSISLKLNPIHGIKYILSANADNKIKTEINEKTSLSNFIIFLNEAAIEWRFVRIDNEKNLYILTEGNVGIIYSFIDNEEELVKIGLNVF